MNIFNYDSKFMTVLNTLADLMIMNVLYVICCLPLFTIGAAQAGLYTGIRVLMDPEDDSSCAKAFFRGFASGFGKVTVVNLLFLVLYFLMATGIYVSATLLATGGSRFPVWMSIIAFAVVALFHSMLGPFHATFDCTPKQLIRNVFCMVMAHPIASLLNTVLIWGPVIAACFLGEFTVLAATPVLLAIYYSLAYLLVFTLLKHPFSSLKEILRQKEETNSAEGEKTASPEEEETVPSEEEAPAPEEDV